MNKADTNNKRTTSSTASNNTFHDAISHNRVTGESMKPYIRQAMYYETDQMGVIHHSNYIRWFEESRVDFLEQIGLSYNNLEANGILIPVLGVSCEYKSSVKFNDKVMILPKTTFFNGFKMTLQYHIFDADTYVMKAFGESRHCFVNSEFKPLNVKKNYKDVYDILTSWIN
jgi:acyl-CoA thioester hydrolase